MLNDLKIVHDIAIVTMTMSYMNGVTFNDFALPLAQISRHAIIPDLTSLPLFMPLLKTKRLSTLMRPNLALGSNTGENPEDIAERNTKNPRTRTRTSFILV